MSARTRSSTSRGEYRRLLVEPERRDAAPEPWLNRNVRVYHEEWQRGVVK